MGSGSEVVGKDEKKKYQIYVEEYVLSYLRRESDSLELSEYLFLRIPSGERQEILCLRSGPRQGDCCFCGI